MQLANLRSASGSPIVAAVQPDGAYLDIVGALEAAGVRTGGTTPNAPSDLLAAAGDPTLAHRVATAISKLQATSGLDAFLHPAHSALLAPIPNPVRILAIGRNYAEHAKEQGATVFSEPIVFLKASTSVIGPDAAVRLPGWIGRVDYEAELLVVLGRGGKNVNEANAMDLVAGYTVFNDITARAQQRADIEQKHPWFRSKSLDTSGPMGPILVTTDEISDPHALRISLRVNGALKQDDNTGSMVYRIPTLIAFLSKWFRLYPGDVIATGTPSGIGPIVPGDVIEATIERIGTLRNPVVAD